MTRQEIVELIQEIENRPLHRQAYDSFTLDYRHLKFLKTKLNELDR